MAICWLHAPCLFNSTKRALCRIFSPAVNSIREENHERHPPVQPSSRRRRRRRRRRTESTQKGVVCSIYQIKSEPSRADNNCRPRLIFKSRTCRRGKKPNKRRPNKKRTWREEDITNEQVLWSSKTYREWLCFKSSNQAFINTNLFKSTLGINAHVHSTQTQNHTSITNQRRLPRLANLHRLPLISLKPRKVAPSIHLLSFGERPNEIDAVDALMAPHIKISIPAPDTAFAKKMHFNSINCSGFFFSSPALKLWERITAATLAYYSNCE